MKFDLPAKKKLVFEMTLPIRWGDMDAMGHVNNTVYFRYMEIVRLGWFRSVGFDPDPSGAGPLIINAFCTFHRQLEYPGDVIAKYYVSDPGRSSYESWCTMARADDPATTYASGGATTVWVDYQKQKSAPMADWFRALLT